MITFRPYLNRFIHTPCRNGDVILRCDDVVHTCVDVGAFDEVTSCDGMNVNSQTVARSHHNVLLQSMCISLVNPMYWITIGFNVIGWNCTGSRVIPKYVTSRELV